MDLGSLEEHVTVEPAIPLRFRFDPEDDHNVIVETKGTLDFDTEYRFVIGKDVKGYEGDFVLGEEKEWFVYNRRKNQHSRVANRRTIKLMLTTTM